jgi:hypothetical protein
MASFGKKYDPATRASVKVALTWTLLCLCVAG